MVLLLFLSLPLPGLMQRSKHGVPVEERMDELGWSGELMAQKSQQQPEATTEAGDWTATYRLKRAACRLRREATGSGEPTAKLRLKKGSGGPKLHECGAQHPAWYRSKIHGNLTTQYNPACCCAAHCLSVLVRECADSSDLCEHLAEKEVWEVGMV